MGGSIRQPAHSCGVCGLKPTSGRLTNVGSRIFNPGMRQIAIQPGPLARRVEDLALAMRVLAPAGRADGQPDETPMPWPEYERLDIGEMRLGMWEDDGFLTPSPAIRRAVREAADALRRRGAEVDPVDPPDVHEMLRLYMGLASADGGEGMIRFLAGSPRDKRITKQLRLGRLPRLVKRPLAAALRMAGQGRSAEMLTAIGACSARAYWDLAAAQEQLRATFLERLAELRIDAILCPPHSLPALLHGDGMYLLGAATACYLPNLLGFPAGVLPATYVREGEESDRAPDRDFVGRLAARCEAGSAGLPVGVQVMGRPWREDIVLAVMHALQEGFRLPLRLP